MPEKLKKFLPAIIMLVVFETVAIVLTLALDNIFYLFNFTYIGVFIVVGLFLFAVKYKHARLVVQFGVGLYIFMPDNRFPEAHELFFAYADKM